MKLESYHGLPSEVPAGVEKYLNPLAKDHGHAGQVIFLLSTHSPAQGQEFYKITELNYIQTDLSMLVSLRSGRRVMKRSPTSGLLLE